MRRSNWLLTFAVVVAAAARVVFWGEISPHQYAILTASAGVASDVWRNEARWILIDGDYITEWQYRRLLADLPEAALEERSIPPTSSRRQAQRALVQALAFERNRPLVNRE